MTHVLQMQPDGTQTVMLTHNEQLIIKNALLAGVRHYNEAMEAIQTSDLFGQKGRAALVDQFRKQMQEAIALLETLESEGFGQ